MTDTFRELCTEVLAFHHGEGCYNFSGLNPYDRDNAAFDAWQDIRQRLKSALAQPAPAPAVVPVAVSARRPGPEDCDEDGFCWMGYGYRLPGENEKDSYAMWMLMPSEESSGEVWRPAHAIPLPQAGEAGA
jgi:hypothetical protein